MLELQPPPVPYRRCSVLGLPSRRRYERIQLLPEVGGGGWLGAGKGGELIRQGMKPDFRSSHNSRWENEASALCVSGHVCV